MIKLLKIFVNSDLLPKIMEFLMFSFETTLNFHNILRITENNLFGKRFKINASIIFQ